jgi:hypothetical protein
MGTGLPLGAQEQQNAAQSGFHLRPPTAADDLAWLLRVTVPTQRLPLEATQQKIPQIAPAPRKAGIQKKPVRKRISRAMVPNVMPERRMCHHGRGQKNSAVPLRKQGRERAVLFRNSNRTTSSQAQVEHRPSCACGPAQCHVAAAPKAAKSSDLKPVRHFAIHGQRPFQYTLTVAGLRRNNASRDYSYPGIFKRLQQVSQPVRPGDRVIIDVGHDVRSAFVQASVPGARESLYRLYCVARRKLAGYSPRLGISLRVIDYQNLIRSRRERSDAFETLPQAGRPVARADDNRDSQDVFPCSAESRMQCQSAYPETSSRASNSEQAHNAWKHPASRCRKPDGFEAFSLANPGCVNKFTRQ